MDHLGIINALGGYLSVARELDIAKAVVWRWGVTRPIPPRRWLWVVQYARRLGVPGVNLKVLAEGYFPEIQTADDLRARRKSVYGEHSP